MNHYVLIKYLTQRLQWQHQNWKLGLLTPNPACHSVSLNISLPSSVLIVWDGLHPPEAFILACDFTPGPVGSFLNVVGGL